MKRVLFTDSEMFSEHNLWLLVFVGRENQNADQGLYDASFYFFPFDLFLENKKAGIGFSDEQHRIIKARISVLNEFCPGTVWNKNGEIVYQNNQIAPFLRTVTVKYIFKSQPLNVIFPGKSLLYPIHSDGKGLPCFKYMSSIIPCSVLARKLFFVSSDIVEYIFKRTIQDKYFPQNPEIKVDPISGMRIVEVEFSKQFNDEEKIFLMLYATMNGFRKSVDEISQSLQIFKPEYDSRQGRHFVFNLSPLPNLELVWRGFKLSSGLQFITQVTDCRFSYPFDIIIEQSKGRKQADYNEDDHSKPEMIETKRNVPLTQDIEIDLKGLPNEIEHNIYFKSQVEEDNLLDKKIPVFKKKETDREAFAHGDFIVNERYEEAKSISLGNDTLGNSDSAKGNSSQNTDISELDKALIDEGMFYEQLISSINSGAFMGFEISFLRKKGKDLVFQVYDPKNYVLLNPNNLHNGYLYLIIRLYSKIENAYFYLIEIGKNASPKTAFLPMFFSDSFDEIDMGSILMLLRLVDLYKGKWQLVFIDPYFITSKLLYDCFRHQQKGTKHFAKKIKSKIRWQLEKSQEIK